MSGFEPRRAKARERLDELRTGDGRPIPGRMKAEIRRELERLDLLRKQIAEIETERDALLSPVEAAKGAVIVALRSSRSRESSSLRSGASPLTAKYLKGLNSEPTEAWGIVVQPSKRRPDVR